MTKAVRIHANGGPEVMRVAEFEPPQPGPDEVLVRVRAADVCLARANPSGSGTYTTSFHLAASSIVDESLLIARR